jgi:DNA ligase-4
MDNLSSSQPVASQPEDDSNTIYVGSKITFKTLTGLFENLVKIRDQTNRGGGIGKNEERKRECEKFRDLWRKASTDLKAKASADQKVVDDYYTVIRLLLPAVDRRVYGLKEAKLAAFIINALSITKSTDDGQKLINYRAPSNVKLDGDFASVAYFVLKNRCQENETLSIHEVNHHLDIIATNNTRGKEGQRDVDRSIKHLLVHMSALQLKWLIRIILRDLKIGITENVVLDAYHPDAVTLYNCMANLEKVCELLSDPNKRLHEIAIELFSPFRPMLGKYEIKTF